MYVQTNLQNLQQQYKSDKKVEPAQVETVHPVTFFQMCTRNHRKCICSESWSAPFSSPVQYFCTNPEDWRTCADAQPCLSSRWSNNIVGLCCGSDPRPLL